jgi:hypothetical protein
VPVSEVVFGVVVAILLDLGTAMCTDLFWEFLEVISRHLVHACAFLKEVIGDKKEGAEKRN